MILTLDNLKYLKKSDKVVHHAKNPYDVFIARPSKWGNPIKLREPITLENSIYLYGDNRREGFCPSRNEVIVLYDNYLRNNEELTKDLPELNGKVLACWCSPKLCHGNAIINYMNDLELERSNLFEY